jgi:Protein of unknown function (DUF1552)
MAARGSISRRDLLRSATGALLLAPLLRARKLEAQSALPKRLVIVFTPDSHPREWWPTVTTGQPGFELQGPLLDFAGLERQMLFVRRVDHSWTFDNHHEAGVAQLFTGQRFFDEATHYANGPSIDQVLLKNTDIRGGTPIADIHLCAADKGGGDKRHVCCYSGPGQPIQREWDPARAFDRIFDGVSFGGAPTTPDSGGPMAAAKRASLRRTLQVNTAELRRIQAFLGKEERERLELHVEALRELELQIDAGDSQPPPATAAACTSVDTSGVNSSDRNDQTIRKWAKVQVDVLVSALACDRTRIAELGFGFSGSHHTGMMGLSKDNNSWHDVVAHLSLSDTNRKNDVSVGGASMPVTNAFIQFDRLWAGQVAYLAKRLSEIGEGDGTMLDNTLIYWGVESGTDHNHSPRDMQYLLIGGRNLGLATGQFLQPAAIQSAHKLHTSVLHAFGYTAATGFGIEPTCGPLPGILR